MITFRDSIGDLATDIAYELTREQGLLLVLELEEFLACKPEKFVKSTPIKHCTKQSKCKLGFEHKGPCDIIGFTSSDIDKPISNNVDHPIRYNSHPSGIECIDVIEHMTFNIGTAIKYLWRAGLKDNTTIDEEYQKAVWYIEQERKRLSK